MAWEEYRIGPKPVERTREEHLTWARRRAELYLAQGDPMQAWSSFAADLEKHEELRHHPALRDGTMLLLTGNLATVPAMRHFLDGFG